VHHLGATLGVVCCAGEVVVVDDISQGVPAQACACTGHSLEKKKPQLGGLGCLCEVSEMPIYPQVLLMDAGSVCSVPAGRVYCPETGWPALPMHGQPEGQHVWKLTSIPCMHVPHTP
jgi:hypothetical protein